MRREKAENTKCTKRDREKEQALLFNSFVSCATISFDLQGYSGELPSSMVILIQCDEQS